MDTSRIDQYKTDIINFFKECEKISISYDR